MNSLLKFRVSFSYPEDKSAYRTNAHSGSERVFCPRFLQVLFTVPCPIITHRRIMQVRRRVALMGLLCMLVGIAGYKALVNYIHIYTYICTSWYMAWLFLPSSHPLAYLILNYYMREREIRREQKG